jgi:hypothetical protein
VNKSIVNDKQQTRKVEFDLSTVREELITITGPWEHSYETAVDICWYLYDEGIIIGWRYVDAPFEKQLINNFKNASRCKDHRASYRCSTCKNNTNMMFIYYSKQPLCDSCHKWASGQLTYTIQYHEIIFATNKHLLYQLGTDTLQGKIIGRPLLRNLRESSQQHQCSYCQNIGNYIADINHDTANCCINCIEFELDVNSRIVLKCIYLCMVIQHRDITKFIYQTMRDLVEGREITFKC